MSALDDLIAIVTNYRESSHMCIAGRKAEKELADLRKQLSNEKVRNGKLEQKIIRQTKRLNVLEQSNADLKRHSKIVHQQLKEAKEYIAELELRNLDMAVIQLEADEDAERLAKIALTIFDVSINARALQQCPHNIAPSYPTHAWWCDGCFGELEKAIIAHEQRIGETK